MKDNTFLLRAQLSVLKNVQKEYPRHSLDNVIQQIETRIKHYEHY